MFIRRQSKAFSSRGPLFLLEGLETRRLLSAALAPTYGTTSLTGSAVAQTQSTAAPAQSNPVILFSAAPTAVQTGLQALAGSTTIPSNQRVHENTLPDGTEFYCIKLDISGTETFLAVDSTGASVPVPQPSQQGGSTAGTSGSGSSSTQTVVAFSAAPSAVQTGLQTLVGSSTIHSNQPVHESELPDGTEIYCIKITADGTSTVYAVDSTGTSVPVPQPPQQGSSGNGSSAGGTTGGSSSDTVVLFSAAPTAVQTGLQTLAGSNTIPSDQPVHESTAPDGTEIYCIKLTVDGTSTRYAVDSTGASVPVPQPPQQSGGTGNTGTGTGGSGTGTTGTGSTGTGSGGVTVVSFSAAPAAVQSGLQTLAGSSTIHSDQPVHESTAPDGTEIYAIKLTVSGTSTVYAVDSSGDPVPVPPPPPAAQSGSSTGSPTGGSTTGGSQGGGSQGGGSQGGSSTGSQQGSAGDQQGPPQQGSSTGGAGNSGGSLGSGQGNGGGQQMPPPAPPQGS